MSLVNRYLEPALIERLNQLTLTARTVAEGSTVGRHRSPLKGSSIEFRQHRPYVAGDEPRRIDWRVLARTDRPYVKEYDEETNLRALLLLDCSGSMRYAGGAGAEGGGSKSDYAAKLVASLAYLMLARGESVGLASFNAGIGTWVPARGGTRQLSRVIEALERTSPAGPSDPGAALHAAAERLGRRSLVVLVSDLLAPADRLGKGLAHLRHERHEVVALRVLDRDELEFPFNRWSKFRGMEGEPSRLAEPALVRSRYLKNFADHRARLEDAARAHRADLYPFVTDAPLADALTAFLQRRAGRGRGSAER